MLRKAEDCKGVRGLQAPCFETPPAPSPPSWGRHTGSGAMQQLLTGTPSRLARFLFGSPPSSGALATADPGAPPLSSLPPGSSPVVHPLFQSPPAPAPPGYSPLERRRVVQGDAPLGVISPGDWAMLGSPVLLQPYGQRTSRISVVATRPSGTSRAQQRARTVNAAVRQTQSQVQQAEVSPAGTGGVSTDTLSAERVAAAAAQEGAASCIPSPVRRFVIARAAAGAHGLNDMRTQQASEQIRRLRGACDNDGSDWGEIEHDGDDAPSHKGPHHGHNSAEGNCGGGGGGGGEDRKHGRVQTCLQPVFAEVSPDGGAAAASALGHNAGQPAKRKPGRPRKHPPKEAAPGATQPPPKQRHNTASSPVRRSAQNKLQVSVSQDPIEAKSLLAHMNFAAS